MKKTLPSSEDKAQAVREMFDRIAPRYDLLNRIISLGLDVRWRRRAVAALHLPAGSLVLDLACGTGDFCRELERAGHRAVGFDFSCEMLRAARVATPLVQADVLALPIGDSAAAGVTSGFALRNVAGLQPFFAETARVVRPGGRIAFLEVSEPQSRLLRAGNRLWFRHAVPLIGAVFSDREAYRYLPRSVAYLPPPDELVSMLRRFGFPDAQSLPLSGGVAQLLVATRR
jgi:demethylmenaquinone methyltransferase / 2-methoxy-6-polyprenyl-1,4-benzoquinol methylase